MVSSVDFLENDEQEQNDRNSILTCSDKVFVENLFNFFSDPTTSRWAHHWAVSNQ